MSADPTELEFLAMRAIFRAFEAMPPNRRRAWLSWLVSVINEHINDPVRPREEDTPLPAISLSGWAP